jgi:hypothetical protein
VGGIITSILIAAFIHLALALLLIDVIRSSGTIVQLAPLGGGPDFLICLGLGFLYFPPESIYFCLLFCRFISRIGRREEDSIKLLLEIDLEPIAH